MSTIWDCSFSAPDAAVAKTKLFVRGKLPSNNSSALRRVSSRLPESRLSVCEVQRISAEEDSSELTLNILPRLLLMIDPPVAAEGKQLPKRGREEDDDKRMDGVWIGDGGGGLTGGAAAERG